MTRKDPVVTWETITPTIAKTYLAKNSGNRKLSLHLVERWAQDYLADDWAQTHEGIGFDENDVLMDGQHRLAAIVMTGKSARMLVTRGLDPNVRDKINIGKRRTVGDILYSEGFNHRHQALGATARAVLHLRRINEGAMSPRLLGSVSIEPSTINEFVHEHEARLQEAISITRNKQARLLFSSPGLFGALYFLFSERNASRASEFFSELVSGANLSATSPVYKLRQHLLADRTDKRSRKKPFITAAMAIKAWNAWLHGAPIRTLKYSENESWPVIGSRKTSRKSKASSRTSVAPLRRAAATKSVPGTKGTRKS